MLSDAAYGPAADFGLYGSYWKAVVTWNFRCAALCGCFAAAACRQCSGGILFGSYFGGRGHGDRGDVFSPHRNHSATLVCAGIGTDENAAD